MAGEPGTQPAEVAGADLALRAVAPAAELSAAERACLELAWQALLAGTAPIGAVVTDATGAIISTGRNAVDGAADPPLVAGSPV
jgi:hypothetical protein